MTSSTDWYAGGLPSSFGACSPSARMTPAGTPSTRKCTTSDSSFISRSSNEDEPGGEHHRAGGDQRSTMRRRAQKLSHAAS